MGLSPLATFTATFILMLQLVQHAEGQVSTCTREGDSVSSDKDVMDSPWIVAFIATKTRDTKKAVRIR